MMYKKKYADDPVIVGYCAGCGNPIYSNEPYLEHNGEMVHIEGVGAVARIIDSEMNRTVNMSCLLLYLQEVCEEDSVIKALGMQRCGERSAV